MDDKDPSWIPELINQMVHNQHQNPHVELLESIREIDPDAMKRIEGQIECVLMKEIGHWDDLKKTKFMEKFMITYWVEPDYDQLAVSWIGQYCWGRSWWEGTRIYQIIRGKCPLKLNEIFSIRAIRGGNGILKWQDYKIEIVFNNYDGLEKLDAHIQSEFRHVEKFVETQIKKN